MCNGLIGEFEKHYGTIAMFPFRSDIWRENAVHMQRYILDLVSIISKYEPVFLFCPKYLESQIGILPNNVTVVFSEYDDIWARDIGPSFIRCEGNIETVDWKFNAWGGKKEGAYYPWSADDSFASIVLDYFHIPCHRVNLVLEGGGIVSDGIGTIFATRSVLLNRNRNPFKKREYIEKTILNATHDQRIVWIEQGLFSDETNGHIDNILSFINHKEVCLAWTEDRANPNYHRVRKAYDVISNITNLNNEKYNIHFVPLPPTQYMDEIEAEGLTCNSDALTRNTGDILPASYLNFYLINGAVLIPAFNCEMDEIVKSLFRNIFLDRDVIQVYSREPLLGGGGIHCLLHEIPLLEESI